MTISPIIGITTHGLNEKGSFHIPATYANCVRTAGGIPLLIPPGEKKLEMLISVFDGFIFTGGGDIDPGLYGGKQHKSIYGVDEIRDTMELQLARMILGADIPTLAICRGLQVFVVVMGGGLKDDILENSMADICHRMPEFKPALHPVKIENPSRLSQILGTRETTCASIHHQAVEKLPAESKVTAYASDGIIEALEFEKHKNLVAVQWHPEVTAAKDPVQQKLFEDLVHNAQQYKITKGG